MTARTRSDLLAAADAAARRLKLEDVLVDTPAIGGAAVRFNRGGHRFVLAIAADEVERAIPLLDHLIGDMLFDAGVRT